LLNFDGTAAADAPMLRVICEGLQQARALVIDRSFIFEVRLKRSDNDISRLCKLLRRGAVA
jgi:hypothetical protein